MTLGELANLLIANAKKYCASDEGKMTVARLADRLIDATLVTELIAPLIALCKTEREDIGPLLEQKLEKWASGALESIHRNSHMNRARGERVINQDTADALIVDFANFACAPLDLAMYTTDLYEA